MTLFPGTFSADPRFTDTNGNIVVLLQLETHIKLNHKLEFWAWGKRLTDGKLFTMTLHDWNNNHTSIDSKAYKEKASLKNTKA